MMDKALMGAQFGAAVGVCIGALFGTFAAIRYGVDIFPLVD